MLEKKRVAEINRIKADFNHAAKSYDDFALLQKEVAQHLGERISVMQDIPEKILDIGSGTGYLTQLMANLFPNSEIYALDIAENMHKVAQTNLKNNKIKFLCQDMHHLDFKDGYFDLIVSNLSFQWSVHLALVFNEIARTLKNDGLVFFSMIAEGSLDELKNAYQIIDKNREFKKFINIETLTNLLKQSSLNQMVIDPEEIIIDYLDLNLLIKDLKKIGANNKNPNKKKGLIGKNQWQNFINAYPKQNGYFSARYNIFYTHAFKAKIHPSHRRLSQQINIHSINPITKLN